MRPRRGCTPSHAWSRGRRWRTGLRAVPAAGVQKGVNIGSSPHNYFTVGRDGCVLRSCPRRVDDAGGCPTVGARIVSAASVERVTEVINPTPHNHFIAGPDCRVSNSGRGRAGGAGGCPIIRIGIVSAASVEIAG